MNHLKPLFLAGIVILLVVTNLSAQEPVTVKIFDSPKESKINDFLKNVSVYQIIQAFTTCMKMRDSEGKEEIIYHPWIKIYIFYKDIIQEEIIQ